jgi:exopolyphosphatase/guanosine-5'-triphosphate,3'-diphosphate pyrophosphatase
MQSLSPPSLSASEKVRCAYLLAQNYPDERNHLEQVARLSLSLFNALYALHNLGPHERDLLVCAALLHDIGLVAGPKAHHKESLKMILEADLPALTRTERLVVANIARYHRKAAPDTRHAAFGDLRAIQQRQVRLLAAILRIADGLDRAHGNAVSHVAAMHRYTGGWLVEVYGTGDLQLAIEGATRKIDLFQNVYGIELRFQACGPTSRPIEPLPVQG